MIGDTCLLVPLVSAGPRLLAMRVPNLEHFREKWITHNAWCFDSRDSELKKRFALLLLSQSSAPSLQYLECLSEMAGLRHAELLTFRKEPISTFSNSPAIRKGLKSDLCRNPIHHMAGLKS